MFDNIGSKLKMLASIFAWGGIISSAIAGLILLFMTPLTAILVFVIGALTSWISSWALYAFGQLVENSDRLVALAEKQAKKQEQPAKDMPKQTMKSAGQSTTQEPEKEAKEETTAPKQTVSEDVIRCSKCGTTQKANRMVCWSCGAKFVD